MEWHLGLPKEEFGNPSELEFGILKKCLNRFGSGIGFNGRAPHVTVEWFPQSMGASMIKTKGYSEKISGKNHV